MIYLNIGSNLPSLTGGRINNIERAINCLNELKFNLIKISSYYETPSYPNKSDPKFINFDEIKTEIKTFLTINVFSLICKL